MSDTRQSMSVLAFLFGAVVVVVGLRRMYSRIAVHRRAVRCRGVVTDLRTRRHTRVGENHGYTEYYPVLAFRTSDGEDVQTEARLGRSWEAYRPGQEVTITYDPHDPSHAYAGRGTWRSSCRSSTSRPAWSAS